MLSYVQIYSFEFSGLALAVRLFFFKPIAIF